MRLVVKVFLFNVVILSFSAWSLNPQLSISQCQRFSKESLNIQQLLSVSSGVRHQQFSNRAKRLKERLNVFCQTPSDIKPPIVVALKAPVSSIIGGQLQPEKTNKVITSSIYKDEQKQSAWLQFYRKSAQCQSYKNNMAELVRCSDEEAVQKRLFEREWQMSHPIKMAKTQKIDKQSLAKITSSTPSISKSTPSISKSTPDLAVEKISLRDPSLYVSSAPTIASHSSGFKPLWAYIGDYVLMIAAGIGFFIVFKLISPFISRFVKRRISHFNLNMVLKRQLNKSKYSQYRNLEFASEDGNMAIEQIVTSLYGIFVVMSQPQLDAIYADKHSESWVEKKQKKETHFDNPIIEINHQKSVLQSMFGLEHEVVGLVVFNQDVQFKTPIPAEVCLIEQLISRISCYQNTLLDTQKLDAINSLLFLHSTEKSSSDDNWDKTKATI
jgi:hypothetical protein